MPILYCRCAYAQVVPEETKDAVLQRLCASGLPFSGVSDLCEMSARRDPRMKELADQEGLKIVACHARAVQWLFHAADAPLNDAQVVNMRELDADATMQQINPSTEPTP